jgi:hypothetical protein
LAYEGNEDGLARQIVREELEKARCSVAELSRRRKGDGVKVRIVARLRCETALTLRRIAELLHMGAPTHVAHLLYHRRDDV